PKPTEAPTEAPKPTEAPTEAPKPTVAPTEAPKPTEAPTEAPDVTNRTIIFSNNKGFGTVNIYYWSDEDQPVDWPGVPMTYYDTNEMGEQRYTFELPAGMTEYIINDGGTQQTVDITFNGATGVYMTDKNSSGNYEVAFYDIGGDTDPTTAPTTAPEPTTPTPSVADGYYLVGTMTNWAADSAYKFSENTSNPGEYMLSTTLSATDGVKAVKVENGEITTWYPDGMDNEYFVDAAHAGNVTIYFNPSGSADWSAFGGYIYIDGGTTPTPDPTEAPTEAPDVTNRTIIFSNNKGFSTVNIYYWSDEDQPVDWPGVPMTYYDTNEMGEKRYSIELPAGMTEYIINDGGTQQTIDITFTGATGVYMTDKDSSGNYQVAFYDIGGEVDPTPEPTTAPQPTQAPEPAKDYVYLNAGGSNLWDQAGARFELYVWNDDGEQWLTGTAVNGKYQFEVPTGYTNGIFTRMNPAGTADDWSGVWNQTGDLTLQIGKTYTITSWNGGDNGNSGGSWS
ncbi:starch-binding protein, partial [Ruminococcus sp.]|uniref:starch-binding protein n=1 Tax=Ruminococcus sp. TaxID=41978 RepID=UPI003866D434